MDKQILALFDKLKIEDKKVLQWLQRVIRSKIKAEAEENTVLLHDIHRQMEGVSKDRATLLTLRMHGETPMPGRIWADGSYCGSCKYACPYDAIKLIAIPGTGNQAPVVDTSRCFGCGACEKICPMESPAILVSRKGALRLGHGSFRKSGEEAGLDLNLDSRQPTESFYY